MNATQTAVTRVGHALSDATRAQIMFRLAQSSARPALLAEELGVSRQSISNHLLCLRNCGLVQQNHVGREAHYQLANDNVSHLLEHLSQLVVTTDPDLCEAAS